jgi:hypothetical protein
VAACQRKAAVPSCDEMAEHVLALFSPPDQFARQVRTVFAEQCKTEQWSDEMRSCVGATTTVTSPNNCKQRLTPDQASKLENSLVEAETNERNQMLPPSCARYEKVLALVVACDKVPANIKADLAAKLVAAKAEWDKLPDKRELGPMCANGLSVLKQVGADCPDAAKW